MASYLTSLVQSAALIPSTPELLVSLWHNLQGGVDRPLDIAKVGINPMTGMAQLALLFYHPEGTKFDFEGHKIVFYDPNLAQGASRAISGSSRDIILKLEPLISAALGWYRPREHAEIQKIFLRTIRGLKILKTTYKKYEVVTSHIDNYIKSIAEACIKGTPKKEPANQFQREVYEMGLKEVADLTRLLNEFPGGDIATYEPEEKYESDSLQETQAQILNQNNATSSNQNRSSGTSQSNPTDISLSNSTSSTNTVNSLLNNEEAPTNEESGAEGSAVDTGVSGNEDEAKQTKENNSSQSSRPPAGSKARRRQQNKDAAAPTATPTANPKQNQASAATADPSFVKTPSVASTPQPVEAKPKPLSELVAVALDATTAKRKSSTELVNTALGASTIAKQNLDAAVKKLIDEEVVPNVVPNEKFNDITSHFNRRAEAFGKTAKQAVTDLLLFK